jgi:predicted transcriptional regulator YdeE|tara:strand:- start:2982 stop:4229 length:1248 start_codon:yes stop_codon:yes gene_type:complete
MAIRGTRMPRQYGSSMMDTASDIVVALDELQREAAVEMRDQRRFKGQILTKIGSSVNAESTEEQLDAAMSALDDLTDGEEKLLQRYGDAIGMQLETIRPYIKARSSFDDDLEGAFDSLEEMSDKAEDEGLWTGNAPDILRTMSKTYNANAKYLDPMRRQQYKMMYNEYEDMASALSLAESLEMRFGAQDALVTAGFQIQPELDKIQTGPGKTVGSLLSDAKLYMEVGDWKAARKNMKEAQGGIAYRKEDEFKKTLDVIGAGVSTGIAVINKLEVGGAKWIGENKALANTWKQITTNPTKAFNNEDLLIQVHRQIEDQMLKIYNDPKLMDFVTTIGNQVSTFDAIPKDKIVAMMGKWARSEFDGNVEGEQAMTAWQELYRAKIALEEGFLKYWNKAIPQAGVLKPQPGSYINVNIK